MENELNVVPVLSKKEIIAKQLLEIAEIKKKLESAESSAKYSRESRDEALSELSDVHEFLDGFDFVIPHTKKEGYNKNKLSTRLMSFFVKSSSAKVS